MWKVPRGRIYVKYWHLLRIPEPQWSNHLRQNIDMIYYLNCKSYVLHKSFYESFNMDPDQIQIILRKIWNQLKGWKEFMS